MDEVQVAWDGMGPEQVAAMDQNFAALKDGLESLLHLYLHYLSDCDGKPVHPLTFSQNFGDTLQRFADDGGEHLLAGILHVAVARLATDIWSHDWKCTHTPGDPGQWVGGDGTWADGTKF